MALAFVFAEAKAGEMRRPAQQARPEFQRPGDVRPIRVVGREIAQGSLGQDHRLAVFGRQERHEGTMPVYLVPADAHGWEEEAIAELAAAREGVDRPFDVFVA